MNKRSTIQLNKNLRAKRTRSTISGTPTCPRFSVFRSNKVIFAQLIDDLAAHTLISGSTAEGVKTAAAFALGKEIAEKAKKAGIEKVVFDRGSYAYHGRVKAVADGAREGGLQF